MSAEARAVLDMEDTIRSLFEASLPKTPEMDRLRTVARVLAQADGIAENQLDRVVMGHPHGGAATVPTIARVGHKGLVAILFPLQPAWAAYIRDAAAAIEAVDSYTPPTSEKE